MSLHFFRKIFSNIKIEIIVWFNLKYIKHLIKHLPMLACHTNFSTYQYDLINLSIHRERFSPCMSFFFSSFILATICLYSCSPI